MQLRMRTWALPGGATVETRKKTFLLFIYRSFSRCFNYLRIDVEWPLKLYPSQWILGESHPPHLFKIKVRLTSHHIIDQCNKLESVSSSLSSLSPELPNKLSIKRRNFHLQPAVAGCVQLKYSRSDDTRLLVGNFNNIIFRVYRWHMRKDIEDTIKFTVSPMTSWSTTPLTRHATVSTTTTTHRQKAKGQLTLVLWNKRLNVFRNVLIKVQFTNIQRFDDRALVQQQQSGMATHLGSRIREEEIEFVSSQSFLWWKWILKRIFSKRRDVTTHKNRSHVNCQFIYQHYPLNYKTITALVESPYTHGMHADWRRY